MIVGRQEIDIDFHRAGTDRLGRVGYESTKPFSESRTTFEHSDSSS
jgi:hypothetical protein